MKELTIGYVLDEFNEELTIKIILKLWEHKKLPLGYQSEECQTFINKLYNGKSKI